MRLFRSLLSLTIFCVLSVQAIEDNLPELAGSLIFHTKDLIAEAKGEKEISIHYEKEDVDALWEGLREHNKESIEKAYSSYYAGDLETAVSLLEEARIEPETTYKKKSRHTAAFENHPHLTPEARDKIRPYLISKNHPLLPALNAIFTQSRATKSYSAFEDAGFDILFNQPRSFILVAKHPELPGHLIKANLDNDLRIKHNIPAWQWYVYRCKGAEKIAKIIKEKNIQHFTVPQKNIYVLPPKPEPPKGKQYNPKIAVLLVEDMNIVDHDKNETKWKTIITPEHLDELYIVISRANGSSYRAGNIPYSRSGKFAFVDTEYPYRDPDYASIRFYLSNDMRRYWDGLVKRGGKKG